MTGAGACSSGSPVAVLVMQFTHCFRTLSSSTANATPSWKQRHGSSTDRVGRLGLGLGLVGVVRDGASSPVSLFASGIKCGR